MFLNHTCDSIFYTDPKNNTAIDMAVVMSADDTFKEKVYDLMNLIAKQCYTYVEPTASLVPLPSFQYVPVLWKAAKYFERQDGRSLEFAEHFSH